MKDLLIFLIYSGISTIFFLILLLSRTWKKRESNKILAGTLLIFLLLFLTYASSYLKWDFLVTIISPIGMISSFALGPFIFRYIKTIYHSKVNYKKFAKSLLPFVVAFVIYSIPQYFFGLSINNKAIVFQIIFYLIPFLGIVCLFYYLFLCNKQLKHYQKLIKKDYSNLKTLDLKWLSIWIKGFIIFIIIDFISSFLLFTNTNIQIVYANLFYLILLIWYIGYYGVTQAQVFLNTEIQTDTKENIHENKPKISSSFDCDSIEFKKLKTQLEIEFEHKELFKKENLSLKEAADILGISDKKLSYLLNICLSSNFYEYVNTYRINYFKKKLEEGAAEKLTLLAIAFDSGFNSKATFNRVFKQQSGITPLEFKKQLSKRSQNFH